MKRILLLLLLGPALLQAAELSNIHPVTPDSVFLMAPRWSPDGQLYCSTPKYAEIVLIDTASDALVLVAAGVGIGFKFTFAPDGSLFYKKVVNEGRELWRIDPAGGESLLAFDYELGLPAWYNDAIRIRFSQGVLTWNGRGEQSQSSPDGWIYQDGGQIFRYIEGGHPQPISPPGMDACLPVQSPDGQRLVYETLTGNLLHVNLATGATVPLGTGNNVVWSADGSFFVFDRTRDDGHRLTAGNIILLRRDQSEQVNLTTHFDGIAVHPAISPDGSRIAFEADGRIWVGDLIMD